MSTPSQPASSSSSPNRRDFLKTTTAIAAATALAGVNIPHVFAAEDNTIRLALIGAGGRGTGAVMNALATKQGPVKLVAMADVFEAQNESHYEELVKQKKDMVDVPKDRRFVGFDAYQKAMDCLRPGDIAIMTTPPAFRWVHFKYAIDKALNVFMEKPVTVDGPTTKKMFALADEALDKNLKVAVGLMCRHCNSRRELYDRIQMGQIGDIINMRAYRVHGPVAECFVPPNPGQLPEVLYQIKNFHSFLWASGGLFSDFNIHNIDECCWMKNAWPVKAEALGGRHYRGDMVDQNFDVYDVEYTFGDGSKLFFQGRCIDGCSNQFASYAHGSKGAAQISFGGHSPAKCKIWRGQDMSSTPLWAVPQPEANPYQLEWDHLMDAIRNDKPYNEVRRGAEASLITSMGRMSAHTGQVITRDQMLNCEHEFAPTVAKLTNDGPAPVMPEKGKYPIPEPGVKKTREY
ncbi:MAG TPA: twin-arginine translocation signal domain-containing protein [Tepidisphaeraceae bacterium]|jgi:predicted dehydrogenase